MARLTRAGLGQVEGAGDRLVQAYERFGAQAEINLIAYIVDQTPIGSLPLPLLQRIVALRADLDIDLYALAEGDEVEE